MLYLLDANGLITAKNQYYEFGRVDQYWEWLVYQGEQSNVKIPVEIYEELTIGRDELSDWAKENKEAILLEEDVDIDLLQRVTGEGYAPDLNDIELEVVGRDPFLIAYAMADIENRIVVTTEVRNKKIRQNRKVPSVCDDFGVKTCDAFQFGRGLDFRTDWHRP